MTSRHHLRPLQRPRARRCRRRARLGPGGGGGARHDGGAQAAAALCRVQAGQASRDGRARSIMAWRCGFRRPNSETGEDMAELQVHGGRAVVAGRARGDRQDRGLPAGGARRVRAPRLRERQARPHRLEGLADLVDAETAAQRRQALRQTEGALSGLYAGWRQRLIAATALMEAAIDFSDEADVASDAVAKARTEGRRAAGGDRPPPGRRSSRRGDPRRLPRRARRPAQRRQVEPA